LSEAARAALHRVRCPAYSGLDDTHTDTTVATGALALLAEATVGALVHDNLTFNILNFTGKPGVAKAGLAGAASMHYLTP